MLDGVARYIHEHEPWAIYLKPVGVDGSLREWLHQWQGDGVIAAVWDPEAGAVADIGLPIVDVVGHLRPAHVPLVHAHDQSVGRVGAEHLLERGFQHFGFIEYGDLDASWSANRCAGFKAAVQEAGFSCDVYTLPFPKGRGGPQTWEKQQQALTHWITSLPKPVGVMTSTDLLGQQFLEACQRAGVIVPEQVAVVGADDDTSICHIASPPLSSVVINDHQRGYEAAALLDRLMKGEPPPNEPVLVQPAGVVSRASTDIMAIEDAVVVKALRFIRDNACDGVAVDDVVKVVPTSRAVLERRFRKLVGRSINNEIVRVRLNRAVELISQTQLELKAVADKAGFLSQSYMTAVFREKLGRTPGSYRSSKV